MTVTGDGGPGGVDPRLPTPFPANTVPLYTVGQVAEMLGVQTPFLRRLDTLNVVSPSRSSGGQRRYTRLEIDDIDRVTQLVGEGMSLAAVQRILELRAEVAELKRQLAERDGS